MQSDKIPFVAIYMITYNHEAYIAKAIESVMMQQTSFDYKLFIGDDCSQDNTRDICKALKAKYPDKIELVLNDKNIGATHNAKQIYKKCFTSGAKYIAMLEGDDYWTDALKLQKQVAFLEQHPQCAFCFHKAVKIKDGQVSDNSSYPAGIKKQVLTESDFFKITTIPTASVLFINDIKLPNLLSHSHGDFLLYCTLLSRGYAGFINEDMAVYRLHAGGVSSKYDSNAYLEKRISELNTERKFPGFTQKVKWEIGGLLAIHILHYLNKNAGKLQLSDKIKYLKTLMQQKSFYRMPAKNYLKLFKALVK